MENGKNDDESYWAQKSWNIDLGNENFANFFSYLKIEKAGMLWMHRALENSTHARKGRFHVSALYFDVPGMRENFPQKPLWSVLSLDPLHLSPSLLCDLNKGGCGLHGFVQGGRFRSV